MNLIIKSKKIFIPLFFKFTIAIVAIVLTFGTINSYLIYSKVYDFIKLESEKRGVLAAKALIESLSEELLTENYIDVQKSIRNFKKNDSSIEYIFIYIPREDIIIHTFTDGFPKNLIGINSVNSSTDSKFKIFESLEDGKKILDVGTPIENGVFGELHIGINENFAMENVDETINVLWIMVTIFLAVGILGAFLFSIFITKPIIKIQESADAIDLSPDKFYTVPEIKIREKIFGKFKPLFRTEDEIDILCSKFNFMLYRLMNAYATIKAAQDKLLESEKLATIGTMASGIAHEVNNPISGIKYAVKRLLKNPNNIEQNKEYLEMMLEATEKIESVVKNLLNFSRKENFEMCEFDIKEIIKKVEILLAHKLDKGDIELFLNINEKDKIIYGSPSHLQQVLLNLILNAIDAIRTGNNEIKKIVLSVTSDENNSRITVEDTGCGIAEKNIKNIFDPFFTTKDVDEGTGLGLSVAWQIINSHNGSLVVESVEGVGSKFIIDLPKKGNQDA